MFCKNCGTEISNENMFCPNCGTSQSSNNLNQNQYSYISPVETLPMTFHNFYKYFLVIFSSLSILGILFNKDRISMSTLLIPVYEIITGALLIGTYKAGWLMTKIMCIFNIVSNSICGVLAFFSTILGGAILSDIVGYKVGGALIIIFCILALIMFGISVVISALILKYYNKRKEYFTK